LSYENLNEDVTNVTNVTKISDHVHLFLTNELSVSLF